MRAFNLQNQKGQPYITAQDSVINFTGEVKKNNAALTTSTELNAAVDRLEQEIAGMASVSFRSVSELPTTGEPNVIYLVPKDSTTPTDVKVEYIWVDNHWESIGTTDIDLSTKQDKLYLYTEDTTTHLVEFPLAKVRASTFECGPITLTSANQSNDGNFVCGINAMSPTHYKCGPVYITENGFIADTVKINEYGLQVNYNNPDGAAIILNSDNNSISCVSLTSFASFDCGPVLIDEYGLQVNYNNVDSESIRLNSTDNSISCASLTCFTSFTCGPVSINTGTGFKCGPVLIETYSSTFKSGPIKIDNRGLRVNYNNPDGEAIILNSEDNSISCNSLECNSLTCFTSFTCGPLSIEGSGFTCGPVNINSAFSCGPVSLNSVGMYINPITISNGSNRVIMHQQICEVSVQGSQTFNLGSISVYAYCTGEIWLTYGSTATAAVQFPTNWHWLNTASPSTPPTFQQGWKYFIVVRNDNSRILARVADSYQL